MKKICRFCIFWNPQERDTEQRAECRRFPPTPNPSRDRIDGIFTDYYYWCGEWKSEQSTRKIEPTPFD